MGKTHKQSVKLKGNFEHQADNITVQCKKRKEKKKKNTHTELSLLFVQPEERNYNF